MKKKRIVPIVEGYGEERAVPCLLKLWLRHRRFDRFFDVPELAINTKGCGKLKADYNKIRHLGIEHYIEAALRNEPNAIIVILDSDEECLSRGSGNGLGPELLKRAKVVAPNLPMSVVVANREYEAWFLANFHSFRDRGLFPLKARYTGVLNPESCRDCKGLVARLLGHHYEETVHQLELTRALRFSMGAVKRSPSYGKLLREMDHITRDSRVASVV